MTPANDDITPAVALQDAPKLPAAPQPLHSLCLSPEDASPPYWVTLSDNLLLSNGTWSSAAPTGLCQAGARGDREQDEGIISRCLASHTCTVLWVRGHALCPQPWGQDMLLC